LSHSVSLISNFYMYFISELCVTIVRYLRQLIYKKVYLVDDYRTGILKIGWPHCFMTLVMAQGEINHLYHEQI
jgi:hypothetical protein